MASGHGMYNAYTAQERAKIGKYAAEHGPAKTVRHCSKLRFQTTECPDVGHIFPGSWCVCHMKQTMEGHLISFFLRA